MSEAAQVVLFIGATIVRVGILVLIGFLVFRYFRKKKRQEKCYAYLMQHEPEMFIMIKDQPNKYRLAEEICKNLRDCDDEGDDADA